MKVNEIYEGDCLDVMRQFPDNCIDTILTDPPYGLSFMGKDWDHGLPGEAYWREALRVAKPGATLMAFGGTRTHHRLVCAIEDAGWEIRDCIMWIYGSGFPKSLDIGKAIDKAKGAEREVTGIKTRADGAQRPNKGNWNIGNSIIYGDGNGLHIDRKALVDSNSETSPSTPLAKQFDGWASCGLKPAYEPIVVAQKPIEKNYAHNAEKWGVSGIWVDGGRIPANERPKRVLDAKKTNNSTYAGRMNGSLAGGSKAVGVTNLGRWPANVILGKSGDRYKLKPNITDEQREELTKWLKENV